MNKPLTPEEVAKLRLPDWFEIALVTPPILGDLDVWQGQVKEGCNSKAFAAPRSEIIASMVAENVANGHVQPAVLDAVWSAVDGKLEYYSQDQDGNVERFATEKDARLDAGEAFGEAVDGAWEEGVSRVEYGIIIRLGGARATGKTSQDEDGNTVTEYEMVTR